MKKINSTVSLAVICLCLSVTMAQAQDAASYMSPFTAVERGHAPGMTYRLLSDNNGTKEYVLVFAKGDEVISGITDFAVQQRIVSARFTAIGALQEATIAWYDRGLKSYKLMPIDRQVELASLIGDIALYNNMPVIHAHCSLGLPDGSTKAGHVMKAVTYPTVELFMTVFPTPLHKEVDTETDLKLIHPELK
jgi:predicted DNA-binding protein with PD1-like motif